MEEKGSDRGSEVRKHEMKILTVIGARPQFIKAAAVSRAIQKNKNLGEIILHTGQHFDEKMSQVFFDELRIPAPKYNLDVSGLTHGAMTGKMLAGIEEVLIKEKPDYVLVYGDTNSTLAGALAASKLHIKVAHVEAGLRSYNLKMPEEINRILTDRISSVLLCPTDTACKNLRTEGYDNIGIPFFNVGDVMYDTTLYYSSKVNYNSDVLSKYLGEKFVLCTIHRAENTDNLNRLQAIIGALNEITQNIKVIVPIHPRTSKIIKNAGIKVDFEIIEPVGYLDMLGLVNMSELVLTDSGGLQKEAFFLKKYCITLRDETEWVELVDANVNKLAGADTNLILEAFNSFASIQEKNIQNLLFGNGNASGKILDILLGSYKESAFKESTF